MNPPGPTGWRRPPRCQGQALRVEPTGPDQRGGMPAVFVLEMVAPQVAGEMHSTALVADALEDTLQGSDEASVLVGDDQLHPAEPAFLE